MRIKMHHLSIQYNALLYLGQFFAIKSKIKNIVFLINVKAKKVFFKVLNQFNEIFRAKKSKNEFLGLKSQKFFSCLKN